MASEDGDEEFVRDFVAVMLMPPAAVSIRSTTHKWTSTSIPT